MSTKRKPAAKPKIALVKLPKQETEQILFTSLGVFLGALCLELGFDSVRDTLRRIVDQDEWWETMERAYRKKLGDMHKRRRPSLRIQR